MALDITSLSNTANQLNAIADLVMVTPGRKIGYQPEVLPTKGDSQSIPVPVLFHYEGENTVSIDSEITDHFVEDNTSIQDNIAIKPEIITVQGFIGELNDVSPLSLDLLKFAAEKLVAISGYEPGLSETALRAYNQAAFAYANVKKLANSAVSAASSIVSTFGIDTGEEGSFLNKLLKPTQTKQQQAFTQFYGYWRERRLFTVQTPWGIFQHMAIQSLKAIQSAETETVTDFEITFKAIRYASAVADVKGRSLQDKITGRAKLQAAEKTFLGNSVPRLSLGTTLENGLRREGNEFLGAGVF